MDTAFQRIRAHGGATQARLRVVAADITTGLAPIWTSALKHVQ